METLIGNGSKLYRRGNALVRTPIEITLRPSRRYFRTCGPRTFEGIGAGTSIAFVRSTTDTNVTKINAQNAAFEAAAALSGNALNNNFSAYVDCTNWYYDVGCGWSCGAYDFMRDNTIGPPYWNTYASAQMSQAAYQFVVPSSLSSLKVSSISINYYAGFARGFGDLSANLEKYSITQLVQSTANKGMMFGVLSNTLNMTPRAVNDAIAANNYNFQFRMNVDSTAFTAGTYGWYPLYPDRGMTVLIPYNLSDGPFSAPSYHSGNTFVNNNRTFYMHVSTEPWKTGTNTAPFFTPSTGGWWYGQHTEIISAKIKFTVP